MSDVKKNTLIINYLPQTLTDEEFESMFANVGTIRTCKIVRDRSSGYSFGFGFVEYVNDSDASRAIEQLNGKKLQNKVIKVAYSRQGDRIKGANLHVRNLPKSYTVKEAESLFSRYGSIVQCRLLRDSESGQSRGIGFVLFNTKDQAEAAQSALNGTLLPGSTTALHVSFAEDKNKPPPEFQPKVMSYSEAVVGDYGAYDETVLGGYGAYSIPTIAGLDQWAATTAAAVPVTVPRLVPRARGRGRGGPVRTLASLAQHRYHPVTSGGLYRAPVVPLIADPSVSNQGYIIYVYNIGAKTTQEELTELFSLYGSVSKVDVIWDFQKNTGKGYGFVTMPDYEEAEYAIQCLNGYNYAGKPLQVSFKTPKA